MARRPAGVTVVTVIVIILGVLQLLGGVAFLFAAFAAAAAAQPPLYAVAIGGILFGIVVLVLGSSLGRGSNAARVILTIFLCLTIVGAIFGFQIGGYGVTSSIVDILLAIIALILLYTGRANDFFRGRAR